jgi:hypothetical protein
VCFACVEEGEFKLGQLCGLNIIVNADDLDEVSEFYQRRGHFDQLMSLMESGLVSRPACLLLFWLLAYVCVASSVAECFDQLM